MRFEQLAVRCYAAPTVPASRGRGGTAAPHGPPDYALVVDVESTTDASQGLTFGSARLIAVNDHEHPRGACLKEVVFYGDGLPQRDAVEGQLNHCSLTRSDRHFAPWQADLAPNVS